MQHAAPPPRSRLSFGDVLGFFAALLGLALLVASARHLLWSDAVELGPVATIVAPAPLPAAGLTTPRSHGARAGVRSFGRPLLNAAPQRVIHAASPRNAPRRTSRPNVPASRTRTGSAVRARSSAHVPERGSQRTARLVQPHAYLPRAQRRPPRSRSSQSSPQRSHRRAQRSHAGGESSQPHLPRARPGAQRRRPRTQRPHSLAAAGSRPAPRSRIERGTGPAVRRVALHARVRFGPAPARRALSQAGRGAASGPAAGRERARRAAIIEPPLGYQTSPDLVEAPAALKLDPGPMPALRIRLKHSH